MPEEIAAPVVDPVAPPPPPAPMVKTEPPVMPLPKAFVEKKILQLSTWRGSQSAFKGGELRGWFAKLMITDLVSITQSESDGNVNVTIVYR